MSRIAIAFLGAMLLIVAGCQHDHADMNASADACPNCPGIQKATADGKCPGCGAMVSTSASADACSMCPGVQKATSDGKCPMCGMNVKKM